MLVSPVPSSEAYVRLRRIDIENFRGIKRASWRLPKEQTFSALIGPGDSTKTTLLTALERALHDRAGMTFADTDFYSAVVDEPIRIRVAVDDLPDELIAMDAFGAFLAGIDDEGEWSHDPIDEFERCVIVELLVEADLEPVWQSYRPPLDGGEDTAEEPHVADAAADFVMTVHPSIPPSRHPPVDVAPAPMRSRTAHSYHSASSTVGEAELTSMRPKSPEIRQLSPLTSNSSKLPRSCSPVASSAGGAPRPVHDSRLTSSKRMQPRR